ncbi:NusG domain II-containing protein [Ruminococcus sp.]|uniref:NusG domain II-containing protein n=1 Tax=Ruminococcus sp. TaxID=41978 RepID=UPI0025EFF096|nr:NusG domain II-containing protein [Ruminococcus sp.]MCR4637862.1 NusG domain II-containing protein [Ruminococcus sp.]
MTKTFKLLIAAIALIFTASVIAIILGMKKSDSTDVEIVQNNKIIYRLDLSKEENRTIRVKSSDGGWNDIKIENGEISIIDADCPDKTCVKTGILRSESVPIVCLPHKLVIRFADRENK